MECFGCGSQGQMSQSLAGGLWICVRLPIWRRAWKIGNQGQTELSPNFSVLRRGVAQKMGSSRLSPIFRFSDFPDLGD